MLRRSTTLRSDPIKGYRIADMLTQITNDDVLFARKLRKGGAQFFAWPGVPIAEVAKGMVDMPKELRTSHVVFGRPDLPLDLAFDLDEPIPAKKMRSAEMVTEHQRARLVESLDVIHGAIRERGEKISSQVVLVSPNLKKLSYHVHIKLEDAAFKDFAHLGAFIRSTIYPKLRSVVDPQIYRPNGMLRIFNNMKDDLTSPLSVYADRTLQINVRRNDDGHLPSDSKKEGAAAKPKQQAGGMYSRAALTKETAPSPSSVAQPRTVLNTDVSDLAAYDLMLHSLIQRSSDSFTRFVDVTQTELDASRTLRRFGHSEDGGEQDGSVDRRPPMPLSKAEALCNVRDWTDSLPVNLASEFSTWVRVGLYLNRVAQEFPASSINKDVPGFATRDMDKEMLDLWIDFSKKCPLKYRIGDCEKRWDSLKPNMDFYTAYCGLAKLVPQSPY